MFRFVLWRDVDVAGDLWNDHDDDNHNDNDDDDDDDDKHDDHDRDRNLLRGDRRVDVY